MKIFAICDTELNYAKKLAERMAAENNVFEQVQVFDSVEAVLEFRKRSRLETLLVAEELVEAYEEELLAEGIAHVFLLSSENKSERIMPECRHFYKYQAASALIQEVLQAYTQLSGIKGSRMTVGEKCAEVIGVFSPVHCVEKTVWSLFAGLILAKERPVLYLNMERYAGFDTLLNKSSGADLAEVFYCLMHEQETDVAKIRRLFENYKGLSYIPPIRFAQELDDLSTDVVMQCVRKIAELAGSGKIQEKLIILDFSGSLGVHLELCGLCDRIFLVQRNDCVTEATVEAFEEECRITGAENLTTKLKKVTVNILRGDVKEKFFELNMASEIGRKVSRILQEEGLFDGGTEKFTHKKA